jgi:putative effector of murein hydrolase LrgA (UPF0299 family)
MGNRLRRLTKRILGWLLMFHVPSIIGIIQANFSGIPLVEGYIAGIIVSSFIFGMVLTAFGVFWLLTSD